MREASSAELLAAKLAVESKQKLSVRLQSHVRGQGIGKQTGSNGFVPVH